MKFDKSKAYPIAMRCNKEQFESIRPILEGVEWVTIQSDISEISAKELLLTNNRGGVIGLVAPIHLSVRLENNRTVHETFNADIFLDACGRVKETRWRFKTREEFEATCEKDENEDYICGDNEFVDLMFELFGKEYEGSIDNLIRVKTSDGCPWGITPEMLVPMEEEEPKAIFTISNEYQSLSEDKKREVLNDVQKWIDAELNALPQYTYHIIRNGQELNSLDELESYDKEPVVRDGEVVVKRVNQVK